MSAAQNNGKPSGGDSQNDEHMFDNMNSPTFETIPSGDTDPQKDNAANLSEEDRQKQIEEWKEELIRVEGEITTLRQVLGSKVRYAAELKRKIGITPFQELKHDFESGIKSIKESDTYQKTNEKLTNVKERITGSTAYQKTSSTLKTAGEKTSAAVTSVGASVSKKMGELRNSQTFKSMEEKVGDVYANVKAKVTGSKSEGNFEEALESESPKAPQEEPLPEEKVPL